MPELPEVETVRKFLNQALSNKTIVGVEVNLPKILKNFSANQLLGLKIERIERVGKYLIFIFESGQSLVSHLRMEGKFRIYDPKVNFDYKHAHIIFNLSDGKKLVYFDSRQFGTMHFYEKNTDETAKTTAKLAPDANSNNWSGETLLKLMKRSNISVKAFLLDQTKIAGIGNIYADEILFATRISPLTKSKDITNDLAELLVKNAKFVLDQAIKHKGTSIDTFTYGGQKRGSYQNFLKVHTRAGKQCQQCGSIIQKIKVAGRGTYFCGVCQPNFSV